MSFDVSRLPASILFELQLAYVLRGKRETSPEAQIFSDIDVVVDGKSISCKLQHKANATGNCSFEHTLKNTATGETVHGNFVSCKADLYAIGWHADGSDDPRDRDSVLAVHLFNTAALKKLVAGGDRNRLWPSKALNSASHRQNVGRKYDMAYSYIVPRGAVLKLSTRELTIDRAAINAAPEFLAFARASRTQNQNTPAFRRPAA